MPNSSSTWVSRSTTASLALDRALCTEPGLEHLVGGQRVGDVAGQRELLDPLAAAACAAAARGRPSGRGGDESPGTAASVVGRRPRRSGCALLAALLDLAVLEHRASRTPGRPSRGRCRRRAERPRRVRIGWVGSPSSSSASGRCGRAAGRGARRSRVGHLVDRRRGDDQHAEERRAAPAAAPRRTACASGRAAGWRRRSRPRRRRLAGGSVSPLTGCGLPLAMCTMPSTPKAQRGPADRPGGRPGRCGRGRAGCASRRSTSTSGTNQPTLPTEPATMVRVTSMTAPGSCHQTAAATTTARPNRNRPTPSRRCSGSRSRADRPMLRAVAPRRVGDRQPDGGQAVSERAEGARDRSAAVAHGAGRGRAGSWWTRCARALARTPGSGARAALLDELRDRLEPDLLDRDEDVLLLRDPGGEDVRVAMVMNLGQSHTSHRDHTMRVGEWGSDSPAPASYQDGPVVRHVRRGAAALALCVVVATAAGGCQEQRETVSDQESDRNSDPESAPTPTLPTRRAPKNPPSTPTDSFSKVRVIGTVVGTGPWRLRRRGGRERCPLVAPGPRDRGPRRGRPGGRHRPGAPGVRRVRRRRSPRPEAHQTELRAGSVCSRPSVMVLSKQ